ncbi:MAG: hypothetical protein HPY79_12375 [Bacteroidales bacterium]|nr:hypothetical protein [Bacteroidales bacterium]
MKILFIILFIFIVEKYYSQQISFVISDSVKIISILDEKSKKKKITLRTTIVNNSDSVKILLFFNKKIQITSTKVFSDTLNFEDRNVISTCSGLRALFYDSLNNIIQPELINSNLKKLNYVQKLIENKHCRKLFKNYNFSKLLILYPHENKKLKVKVFLINEYKHPLIYTKNEIVKALYKYPLNKGNYNLELNYFILNKNSYIPDYIEYPFLYTRFLSNLKINRCYKNELEEKIFIGHIKSNKIKLYVK